MFRFATIAAAVLLLLVGNRLALATTVEFGGRTRAFEMYVPPTAPRPLPVVLVLHGGKSTAEQMRRYTDFDSLAAREGILAVYPQGIGGSWNDGRRELETLNARAADADDGEFLLALIDILVDRGLADPKRIYVAGISNGGMMALRLACEHPERIAGAAVVAANQPEGIDCNPTTAVPIVFFYGTKDRFIPYRGGDILQWANVDRGRVLSAADTVQRWRDIDGCSGEPQRVRFSEGSKANRLPTDKVTFGPCSGGEVVEFITRGGGHAWPGARQGPAGDALLGPADTGIDANSEIWDFFKAQSTP
jgi:polyhydroxybutyrate depolymerase